MREVGCVFSARCYENFGYSVINYNENDESVSLILKDEKIFLYNPVVKFDIKRDEMYLYWINNYNWDYFAILPLEQENYVREQVSNNDVYNYSELIMKEIIE